MLRLWLAHDPLARSIAANVSSHPNSQAVASSPAPSSDRSGRDYSLPTTCYSLLLISYFRSGWAFLIPYLAAYLLYAWLRWPVNAGSAGSMEQGAESWMPCLLHVYWTLHAINVVLGGIALRAWWKGSILNLQLPTSTGAHSAHLPSTVHRPPSGMDRLWAAMPWFCLALLFYIPGVYLEWPSDPWEHLRRINEWRGHDLVIQHSAWMKSSYFIPYSVLSWATGLRQIFWLNFYYTGICLLLCWQYYRLARACDLSERASMMFVLLQALLFGNNIFSFYRYYGISSSIYAQLGAVALTRVALEAAKSPQLSLRSLFSLPPFISRLTVHRQQSTDLPTSAPQPTAHSLQSTVYCLLITVIPLLALTAFNHLQGLGIAGFGIAAVAVWRLIEWKSPVLWWLIGSTIIANVFFLWLYPRSALIESYRTSGWLNSWYSFNILDFTSLAGDRMLQIVSFFGLFNLAAAVVLYRRHHVIVWLTILPLGMWLLPCIAVPLAESLAQHGGGNNIVTVQRMLFSIPPYLALVCMLEQLLCEWSIMRSYLMRKTLSDIASSDSPAKPPAAHQLILRNGFFAFVCFALIALAVAPSASPSYNRLWNTFTVVPNDLRLRDVFSQYEAIKLPQSNSPEAKFVATQAGAALRSSHTIDLIGPSPTRVIGLSSTDSISAALDFLAGYAKDSTQRLQGASGTTSISKPIEGLNLVAAPKLNDFLTWTSLGGNAPELVNEIADLPIGQIALQNPAGTICYPFSPAIPILRFKSYRLEMTVRQIVNTGATAHLAVAWYDADGKYLESHVAPPRGAGNPRGWVSGTFSYFGLIGQSPSTFWTTFGISFGLGELAAIPPQACFIRVGALLNQSSIPSAAIQLANVRLVEKATPEIRMAIPAAKSNYSTASQAALLSAHWLPQQVTVDRAGSVEILEAEAIVGPLAPK